MPFIHFKCRLLIIYISKNILDVGLHHQKQQKQKL